RVLPYPFERFFRAIVEHDHVGDALPRNARCDRGGLQLAGLVLEALDQNFVEHSVIVAGERDDLVSAGNGSRHAHCRKHGFRARIAERHAFVAGHFAERSCHFTGKWRLRAGLKSLMKLSLDRLLDKVRSMTEPDRSETIDESNVLLAI